ncbi:MAG: DUF6089 family protein [Bacteroidales bacterium]|nr:DUF6089 family protein [Bacteroidales bacterium]MDP2235432.1 DUF6089 family protein [Bacteroidales bacterium]
MLDKLLFKILFVVLFISLMITTKAYPQEDMNNNELSSWQIGLYGGFSQYYGDISNKTYFQKFSGETGISFGLHFRRHFNENFGLGVAFNRSNLLSKKDFQADQTTPFNREYTGTLNHFSVHSYLNFSNFFWGYTDRKLNIYGTLGLGYATWTGTLRNSLNGSVVEDASTALSKNLSKAAPSFPATFGIEYSLSENLKLTFEGTLLTIFSDDLDYYRDGYQYDIITQTHFGISYFIKSGGSARRVKQPSGTKSSSSRWEPLMPVSVIEYEVFPELPSERKSKIEIPPLTLTPVQEKVVPQPASSPAFEFRVQIYAKSQRVTSSTSIYRNIQFEYPIIENHFNGIYRYSTGSFRSYSDAESYARQLQSRGVYDAFVVAYRNNERVSITSEMKR